MPTDENDETYENYDELFRHLKHQNDLLKTQIQEKNIDVNVGDQLVNYQQMKVGTIRYVNFLLYWIYHLVILIAMIVFFYYNKRLSLRTKCILILLFILYPYMIGYMEKMIFFGWA